MNFKIFFIINICKIVICDMNLSSLNIKLGCSFARILTWTSWSWVVIQLLKVNSDCVRWILHVLVLLCAVQLHHIVTATLVWLYSRTDLNRMFLPVVVALLAFSCYRPLIIEYGFSYWTYKVTLFFVLSCTVGIFAYEFIW